MRLAEALKNHQISQSRDPAQPDGKPSNTRHSDRSWRTLTNMHLQSFSRQ